MQKHEQKNLEGLKNNATLSSITLLSRDNSRAVSISSFSETEKNNSSDIFYIMDQLSGSSKGEENIQFSLQRETMFEHSETMRGPQLAIQRFRRKTNWKEILQILQKNEAEGEGEIHDHQNAHEQLPLEEFLPARFFSPVRPGFPTNSQDAASIFDTNDERIVKTYLEDFEKANLHLFVKVYHHIISNETLPTLLRKTIYELANRKLRIEFSYPLIARTTLATTNFESFHLWQIKVCRDALFPKEMEKKYLPHDITELDKKFRKSIHAICADYNFYAALMCTPLPKLCLELSDLWNDYLVPSDPLNKENMPHATWLLSSPLPEKRRRNFELHYYENFLFIAKHIKLMGHLHTRVKSALRYYINLRLQLEYSDYQSFDSKFLTIDKFWNRYLNKEFFDSLNNDFDFFEKLSAMILYFCTELKPYVHNDCRDYIFFHSLKY